MPEQGPVSYELDGRIATIAMDDGKVNALSIAMLRELHGAFDQAELDQAIVVLTGRENYFSAGFDLKVFAAGGEGIMEMLRLGATLAERVLGFPTPVLTACSGHAIAAGTFLPLCADARIGVEGPFRIGLNEVKIGLTVPWFAIEIARQRLHPAHFARAVVNAATYSPSEAVAAGFLDRVVQPHELAQASLETAQELCELNAEAHTATKLRVREQALSLLRAAIESELEGQTVSAAGQTP
jgi:enoyl-CoA hydratase